MSLAPPTFVLLIWFMQLINGTQFSNFTYLFLLFGVASVAAVFWIVIVPFTSTYASL